MAHEAVCARGARTASTGTGTSSSAGDSGVRAPLDATGTPTTAAAASIDTTAAHAATDTDTAAAGGSKTARDLTPSDAAAAAAGGSKTPPDLSPDGDANNSLITSEEPDGGDIKNDTSTAARAGDGGGPSTTSDAAATIDTTSAHAAADADAAGGLKTAPDRSLDGDADSSVITNEESRGGDIKNDASSAARAEGGGGPSMTSDTGEEGETGSVAAARQDYVEKTALVRHREVEAAADTGANDAKRPSTVARSHDGTVKQEWMCDVCGVLSFLDFEEACRHEATCTGPPSQEENDCGDASVAVDTTDDNNYCEAGYVWACDTCNIATFSSREEACRHEATCSGAPPSSAASNSSAAVIDLTTDGDNAQQLKRKVNERKNDDCTHPTALDDESGINMQEKRTGQAAIDARKNDDGNDTTVLGGGNDSNALEDESGPIMPGRRTGYATMNEKKNEARKYATDTVDESGLCTMEKSTGRSIVDARKNDDSIDPRIEFKVDSSLKWLCSVCKVAAFSTEEEACGHEKRCTIASLAGVATGYAKEATDTSAGNRQDIETVEIERLETSQSGKSAPVESAKCMDIDTEESNKTGSVDDKNMSQQQSRSEGKERHLPAIARSKSGPSPYLYWLWGPTPPLRRDVRDEARYHNACFMRSHSAAAMETFGARMGNEITELMDEIIAPPLQVARRRPRCMVGAERAEHYTLTTSELRSDSFFAKASDLSSNNIVVGAGKKPSKRKKAVRARNDPFICSQWSLDATGTCREAKRRRFASPAGPLKPAHWCEKCWDGPFTTLDQCIIHEATCQASVPVETNELTAEQYEKIYVRTTRIPTPRLHDTASTQEIVSETELKRLNRDAEKECETDVVGDEKAASDEFVWSCDNCLAIFDTEEEASRHEAECSTAIHATDASLTAAAAPSNRDDDNYASGITISNSIVVEVDGANDETGAYSAARAMIDGEEDPLVEMEEQEDAGIDASDEGGDVPMLHEASPLPRPADHAKQLTADGDTASAACVEDERDEESAKVGKESKRLSRLQRWRKREEERMAEAGREAKVEAETEITSCSEERKTKSTGTCGVAYWCEFCVDGPYDTFDACVIHEKSCSKGKAIVSDCVSAGKGQLSASKANSSEPSSIVVAVPTLTSDDSSGTVAPCKGAPIPSVQGELRASANDGTSRIPRSSPDV